MGNGSYSIQRSQTRESLYVNQSTHELFTESRLNIKMNPANVTRECCDSEEHPGTIPVIVALDVTGSMGSIPTNFVKEGMSTLMSSLYKAGLGDAQVLFAGVGDHLSDRAPLQVSQFEADDELLDQWLKMIFIEGGGGGNGGESYLLAWKFASDHTKIDSFDKRGRKGILFTIGDEPTHSELSVEDQKRIFGPDAASEITTADDLLRDASKKYEVFHINVTETRNGASPNTQGGWKERMGDNCLMADDYRNIPEIIAATINKITSNKASSGKNNTQSTKTETSEEEIIL